MAVGGFASLINREANYIFIFIAIVSVGKVIGKSN